MSDPKPRPDLWSRAALVVAMLRRLLRACAPEAFVSISAEARALLAAATAMVRRYIHALAADISLPPARAALGAENPSRTSGPPAAQTITSFRWRSIPAAGQARIARQSRRRCNGPSSGKPPPASPP